MTREIAPLLDPGMFTGIDGVAHLCTGGEAPWLKEYDQVHGEFARLKSGGLEGREEIYRRGESCRGRMARLWGVPRDRLAFVPSAAEGMGWLARGLRWRSGDNIVTDDLEFPSVAYAWREIASLGVEVRMVPHQDWRVGEEELLAAVDDRTRVLAVSQVGFYTGQNLDVEALARGLTAHPGCLLAVDATHASGVVRVPAAVTDLCVSSSYKWMLATHGTAPCYLSERADEAVRDSCFGWRNLAVWPEQGAVRSPEVAVRPMPERLEPGNPAMVVIMFLERALSHLEAIGVKAAQEHARDLSEAIDTGLRSLGRTVISPSRRPARSGNTCFLDEDAAALARRLAARGVLVWGEYGRVRISGHVYNGTADVARVLEVLEEVGTRRA